MKKDGQCLQRLICQHSKIKTIAKWYKHHSEAKTDGENVTILWKFPLHTEPSK